MLFAAAVLPAVVLLAYVYKKDTIEKEPPALIARLFFLGMVAGPVAAIVESVAFDVFEALLEPGILLLALEYFLGVALVEEGAKYLFLHTVRNHPAFDYVFDGVVYSVAVALGFATLENLIYVFEGGLEVAAMRAVLSVPGHCADGVVMGVFFGMAKQHAVNGEASARRRCTILAIGLPVLEHGFYDMLLSTENDGLAIIAMLGQIAFIVFAMIMVNRASANDKPLYGTPRQILVQQQVAGTPPQQPTPNAPTPGTPTRPSMDDARETPEGWPQPPR